MLQAIHGKEADPGLHAAAAWLLRKWQQEAWLKQRNEELKEQRDKRLGAIAQSLAKAQERAAPRWYVNSQGQTLVVIPGPVEFDMGSPPEEEDRREYEPRHKKKIGRTFAVAAEPVTLEQYRRFEKNFQLADGPGRLPDLPAVGIDWYRAAMYCNWLSKEEGVAESQWCYEIKGNTISLKARYLSLSGYRLPTEAEMEYAIRAGSVTARYFGETEELLPKYAWYSKNSQDKAWPVGSLKPNDFGLFDMQGNVFTWCQESYQAYPASGEASDDQEDAPAIDSVVGRVLRGGSFTNLSKYVRSANRYWILPAYHYHNVGFRPARTFTP